MNDQDINRLLNENLVPKAFSETDDATLEALLDAQESEPAYGQGILARSIGNQESEKSNRYLAIAALLLLMTIPVGLIVLANHSPEEQGGLADAKPNNGGTLIEITPEFPDPVFQGTPRDIRLPNLEPARSPRLTFTAPEDVHLISKGAKVTSSKPPLFGNLKMVTDSQKTGDDAHFVELPPEHQWVQIDLGEPHKIFAIALWHLHHQKLRAYQDVVIQASPDPSFSSGTTIVYNNDHDNSLGLGAGDDPAYIETNHGRIIDVPGVVARYVRLHSNGSSNDELNHYTEVEVWGQ